MAIVQTYDSVNLSEPPLEVVPDKYKAQIEQLFSVWSKTRARNQELSRYYGMKNKMKDLGISIPEDLVNVNCVVGWAKKAVDAKMDRSHFDAFVFDGEQNEELDAIARDNDLTGKVKQAGKCALIHGLSAMSVMRGNYGEPAVKIRVFSANQFACLWNKDKERIDCGIVLADADTEGIATKYVAHFDDAVLTFQRYGTEWVSMSEPHIMGRPMMELFVNDPDIDRPLGHSDLTPELRGIIDKAMRDVLRMEIGAEFFTFPQRYAIGVQDDIFSVIPENATRGDDGQWYDNDTGETVDVQSSDYAKWKAYLGAFFAIGTDENGEKPTVGQFEPAQADNFTRVFENDAQRFSGATNVPLSQLGVLSNNYTSSDALGASNNPLILSVENMNEGFKQSLRNVALMTLAVINNCSLNDLTDEQRRVQANFRDPSMPTITAVADAWVKLASVDNEIVGTRIWYEHLNLSTAEIDRLEAQKNKQTAIQALNAMAASITSE